MRMDHGAGAKPLPALSGEEVVVRNTVREVCTVLAMALAVFVAIWIA